MKKNTNYSALFTLAFIGLFLSSFIETETIDHITETEKNITGNKRTIDSEVNDGPYIFIGQDSLIEKSIVNGSLEIRKSALDSKETVFTPEPSAYTEVKKIAAFSDLHGQYDLVIEILKNNEIINKDLEWSFGEGHLVITGDIFDRGDKVTEILWFVYNLEKQASKQGGKVHYLLGNHEYMVMHNRLRYINKKYKLTSELLGTPYNELFGKQTLLGRWLRSKPTIITINDNLFVHGGISQEFISQGFDIDETNRLMRESIDKDMTEMKSSPFYEKYHGNNSPIWYRGYFVDKIKESEVEKILSALNMQHIIVGHTSYERVEHSYHKRIFAVDSGIKNGQYGEILFIEEKSFLRGKMNGKRMNLKN